MARSVRHFWEEVNEVIKRSDVILEILDARLIDETRNLEIEGKIQRWGKKLIHVVNKIDLVDRDSIKDKLKQLSNPVFVSSKDRLGTTILKNKILSVGRQEQVVVGVVGYPNTGKSSVINSLAGSKKARTSSTSGFTRGIQKVKASDRIMLLDSPGVFPFEEKDIVKHTLVGAKNFQEIKDPDSVAIELIKILKGRIERHYGVELLEDYDQTLENIAMKIHID
jgi:ribosome biogenesis GTPase A